MDSAKTEIRENAQSKTSIRSETRQPQSDRERFLRTLLRADLPHIGSRAVLRCAANWADAQSVTLHLCPRHNERSLPHPIANHHTAGMGIEGLGIAHPWSDADSPALKCFRADDGDTSTNTHFPFADIWQKGFVEFWAVPLRSRGRYLGWLGFYFGQQTHARAQKQVLLEEIGASVSNMLRRGSRRDVEPLWPELRLQSLRRTHRIFVGSHASLQERADAVTGEIAASIGDACSLFLLDETQTQLRLTAKNKRGTARPTPDFVPVGHEIAGDDDNFISRCLRSGESLIVPYAPASLLATSGSPLFGAAPGMEEGMGFLACPIRNQNRIMGVFVVTRGADRPRFQKYDLEWLELLSDQAALGFENQRRFAAELEAQQKACRAQFWLELRHQATNEFSEAETEEGVIAVIRQAITRGFPEQKALFFQKNQVANPAAQQTDLPLNPDDMKSVADFFAEEEAYGVAWRILQRDTAPAVIQAIWQSAWENIVLCPLGNASKGWGGFVFPIQNGALCGADELRYLEQLADKSCSALLRIELLEQLRKREQEARELSELQSVMMGIVGHDLRNPLAAIRMGGGMIQQMLPNESRPCRLVRRIVRTAARAEGLIQQLLDYSVIRAGQGIPLKRSCGDANAWLKELVDELHLSHPHRDIQLHLTEKLKASWDWERMAQALGNLIINALHYGNEDKTIHVELIVENDFARLCVRNRGPALTTDDISRLFRPFERGKSQAVPGSGLGLFIVREVTQAHGGHVDVSSADGETCFTLHLPTANKINTAPCTLKQAFCEAVDRTGSTCSDENSSLLFRETRHVESLVYA